MVFCSTPTSPSTCQVTSSPTLTPAALRSGGGGRCIRDGVPSGVGDEGDEQLGVLAGGERLVGLAAVGGSLVDAVLGSAVLDPGHGRVLSVCDTEHGPGVRQSRQEGRSCPLARGQMAEARGQMPLLLSYL